MDNTKELLKMGQLSDEIFVEIVNNLLEGENSEYFFNARIIAVGERKKYFYEIAIVTFYTIDYGKRFNEILKTQEESDEANLFKIAMTYALERLVKAQIAIPYTGKLYRGTRELSDGIYECEVGEIFQSHSFLSSTDDIKVANDYEDGCLIEIDACACCIISVISQYPEEQEFIFLCGSEFEILSSEMSNGVKLMKMKQLCN
jgi:hypothetical protein